MKMIVDGVTYPAFTKPNNRTVIAFEAAMGCTFGSWRKKMAAYYKKQAAAIKEIKDSTPEDVEPDISGLDLSLPGIDATALVFIARRIAETGLQFDDVDFTDLSFEPEPGDDDEESDAQSAAPDPHADPTDGSPTTVSEPPAESSQPGV